MFSEQALDQIQMDAEAVVAVTKSTAADLQVCRPIDTDGAGSSDCAQLTDEETKNTDTSFICQLCSQPFKDPRMLSCLHSFCQKCIQTEVERLSAQQDTTAETPQQRNSIKCPTCIRTVSIPAGGVNDLPQDLHLDFKTQCAQYQSKISQKIGVACDDCIDSSFGPALGFCCTCIKFLCKMCCDYHKHARNSHHHNIFALGKEVSKKELFGIKPSEPSCSLHDQNKLRFYCETCNCMICRDCTVVVHKDHKCVELSSIAQSCRNGIKGLLAYAQEIVSKFMTAIDGNINALEKIEASEKPVAQTIKDTFMLLHKALDDRMNQLLEDVHSVALSRTIDIGTQSKTFEALKQDVSHYSHLSSHIVQAYTDHELMSLKQLPLMELQAAVNKTENVSLLPCRSSELKLTLQTSAMIREISILGYVMNFPICPARSKWIRKSIAVVNTIYKLKVEALDSSGQKYLGDLKVEGKIQQHNHNVEGQVENNRDGTYTITFTPQSVGRHQLLITIDGECIKNIPYDLEVRHSKPNYRISHLFHSQRFNSCITSPLCIAVHDCGDIFIGSESNCVYVLDQNGVQKSVIGSKGNDPGQFNTPSGLAVKENVLYVADCDNHRIQKLTIGGDFITMFGKLGPAKGEFNCPCALVVDCNDRLIIVDRGNYRIQIMNLDGTVISLIGGDQLGFQSISGLAGLDPAGNILVIHSSAIEAISLDGTHVKTYTCSQYGKPIAGATDYQGYILILVETLSTLVVFDPLGNEFFKWQIASCLPVGVALNPNDIVVHVVAASTTCPMPFLGSNNHHQQGHLTGEKSTVLLKYNM